ncbi:M28 family peptidase [Altererythrobacter arenosus]|uniref:M28 family peptidase n=1 Tax=Altererythrobacter arenosus TaxID=3032592 RepID=A0ABY8FQE0_9SPHN|nr:M28 family peptidase [Altererythrobacter sp. CAU 1644]WFL77234.1 M28 family peptidase [Altererythrobacter sp. CAU 1644]
MQILASEEYGGREPGTPGGRLTEQYLIDELGSYGFQPAAPGGGWRQNFGLVRYSPGPAVLSMQGPKARFSLSGEGLLLKYSAPRVRLEDRGAVFVGSAEGLEEGSLSGQIALVRPLAYQDFTNELRDAEPAVIVALFEDEESFAESKERMGKGRFDLVGGESSRQGILLVSPEKTREFTETIGKSLDEMTQLTQLYKGPYLVDEKAGLVADLQGENRETANIVGVLPGKVRGSGVVMLMSHWDHLGICRPDDPIDPLCNGAIDNASGVGMMLETARRVAVAGPLDRDLYVIGLTSEEMGLLGAQVLADDPPAPLLSVVAAFNMDSMAIAPRGSTISVVGGGLTPLDAGIREVAAALGRKVELDVDNEQFVQRQDGWIFLSRDVPTVVVSSWMGDKKRFDDFMATRYHKPSDEWRPDLELGGATEDIFLHVELLRYFGNEATYRLGG